MDFEKICVEFFLKKYLTFEKSYNAISRIVFLTPEQSGFLVVVKD